MKKRKKTEASRDEIFNAGRLRQHRIRLVIEVDVPLEEHDTVEGQRAQFNQGALSLIGQIERPCPESVMPHGCRVVLVTTEDA